jgi:hypothetical protein
MQYAIVVDAPGGNCGSDCYYWGTALANPYAAGEALDGLNEAVWFSPGDGLDRTFKTYVTPTLPSSKQQCKDGGWLNFPQFKNEGDCVSFVVAR